MQQNIGGSQIKFRISLYISTVTISLSLPSPSSFLYINPIYSFAFVLWRLISPYISLYFFSKGRFHLNWDHYFLKNIGKLLVFIKDFAFVCCFDPYFSIQEQKNFKNITISRVGSKATLKLLIFFLGKIYFGWLE